MLNREGVETIFLVDDSESDILLFDLTLQEVSKTTGFKTASNGEDALARLESAEVKPSVIILDINMPIMNGWEFLSAVKSKPEFAHIPVIMFSTTDNQAEVNRAYDEGACLFCQKPFQNHDLKLVISLILAGVGTGYSIGRMKGLNVPFFKFPS